MLVTALPVGVVENRVVPVLEVTNRTVVVPLVTGLPNGSVRRMVNT